jgi:hypothetical protein
MEKTIKKVCHCEKCGNESEMVITCALPEEFEINSDLSSAVEKKSTEKETKKKVKGTAVCSHCGNEADMWIDL